MDSILDYSDDEESASAHTLCMICKEKPRIYKCPGCGLLSCSLRCCTEHKTQTGCTGKRNRVDYISMSEYKERNLVNDYHFLEDVLQTKESGYRVVKVAGGLPSEKPKLQKGSRGKGVRAAPNQLPRYLQQVVDAARARETSLMLMPHGMSKRTSNTTRYVQKADLILWKVDFIFILNDQYSILDMMRCSGEIGITKCFVGSSLPSVKESFVIDNLVDEHFFQMTSTNATVRHALRSLRLNRSNLRGFIQHIPSSSSSPLFHEVPLAFTIADALRGKAVIEHPTVFIGLYKDTLQLSLKIATIDTCEYTSMTHIINDVMLDQDKSNDDGDTSSDEENDESMKMDIEGLDMMDINQLVSEIGKRSLDDLRLGELVNDDNDDVPLKRISSADTSNII